MSYNQTLYDMLNNFSNIFFQNFLPELIGAAFGAALGAYWGYKYGIKQERLSNIEEENNIKKTYIDSLLMELERNEEILSEGLSLIDVDGIEINYLPKILWTYSFDSGIASGKYSLLTRDTQKSITRFYLGCKQINENLSQKLRDLNEVQLRGLSEGVELFHTSLTSMLPRVKRKLQDELPD